MTIRKTIAAAIVALLVVASGMIFTGCGGDVDVNVYVDCPKTCVDVKAGDVTASTPPTVPAAPAPKPAPRAAPANP